MCDQKGGGVVEQIKMIMCWLLLLVTYSLLYDSVCTCPLVELMTQRVNLSSVSTCGSDKYMIVHFLSAQVYDVGRSITQDVVHFCFCVLWQEWAFIFWEKPLKASTVGSLMTGLALCSLWGPFSIAICHHLSFSMTVLVYFHLLYGSIFESFVLRHISCIWWKCVRGRSLGSDWVWTFCAEA